MKDELIQKFDIDVDERSINPIILFTLLSQNQDDDSKPLTWIIDIFKQIRCKLIKSQRLEGEEDEDGKSRPAVLDYSEDIIEIIERKNAEYNAVSQERERSFPKRLYQIMSKKSKARRPSKEDIDKKLKELDEKRKLLENLGLLKEPEEEETFQWKVEEPTIGVLSLWSRDVEKKYEVFDDIVAKISLFKEIINKRFENKSLHIDGALGFVIRLHDGNVLSPEHLSSGEQHEIVLNYELLFDTVPDELILIDEPEISLHVIWQNEFLDDIEEIARISDLRVIVATHSPNIMGKRGEEAVGLMKKG